MSIDSIDTISPVLRELVERGMSRRWISYEELNTCLPDEFVDPEKIDELLVFMGEHSIEMVDEVEVRRNNYVCFEAPLQTNLKFQRDDPKRGARADGAAHAGPAQPSAAALAAAELEIKKNKRKKKAAEGEAKGEEEGPDPDDFDVEEDILDDSEMQAAVEKALAEQGSKRIDDPIRMYLTQMGTIPLLTREEEIRLAKKIETTRMIFRRKVLESDYAAGEAVKILKDVHAQKLPVDRTMRISTAEPHAKQKIEQRIPANLPTIERLLKTNLEAWEKLEAGGISASQRAQLQRDITLRRRRIGTLLEECCLRTGRIIPLYRKLLGIISKMREMQRNLQKAEKHPGMGIITPIQRIVERAAPGVLFNDLQACHVYQQGEAMAPRIEAPLTLILGDRDRMTPLKSARAFMQNFPRAGLILIQDCGHGMMEERPEETWRALSEAFST